MPGAHTHLRSSKRVCHCIDCKQTSGSLFSASVLVPKKYIRLSGPLREYTYLSRTPNGRIGEHPLKRYWASDVEITFLPFPVTRVFCATCGSCIAFRSPAFRDMEAIFTGTLPYFSSVPFTVESAFKPSLTSSLHFQFAFCQVLRHLLH